jgi:hypothetical protein
VANCAAETMQLTSTDEENLRIFERKKRILGPRRTEEGDYRTLIVGFVKTQRLRWFRHIQRRDPQHTRREIMNWKSVEERPKGRPRIRWEDQINEDTRRIGIEGWRSKIHDRKTWAKPENTAEYRGRAQE